MGVDAWGADAGNLYTNIAWMFNAFGKEESTRNGMVKTIQRPVTICLRNPQYRVLFAPIRRPNHVFHMVEALWMLAGRRHVGPILGFNSNIWSFTENGIMHGAYGHRWIEHFGMDQIMEAAARLRTNSGDRQAVITMWDPEQDLIPSMFKDRPCNTHLYLRVVDGRLDMHVLNRSNDFLWGMLGSNIVHFTMLHEVLAAMVEQDLGNYYVTTNNLHYYLEYPNIDEVMFEAQHLAHTVCHPQPLIRHNENGEQFLLDCENFVANDWNEEHTRCRWFSEVAAPMVDWYRNKQNRDALIGRVRCPAWNAGLRQFGGMK